ncbi:hypothetical protein ACWGI8_40445 [Streptomyces sp. NPDC054841]
MTDPLALLHRETVDLNLGLTPDLLGRVMEFYPGRLFQRLLDPATALSVAAELWRATYNKLDPERAIPVCLALRNVLRSGPDVVGARFGGLRWDATFCHLNLYLAGSLHQHATELMGRGRSRIVRPMFDEAIRCWSVVEPDEDRFLAPGSKARRIWRGMRGVTQLYLARHMRQPYDLLRGARADLQLAEERGDTSEGHFTFLLEVFSRLSHDPAELPALWDATDELIARAAPHVGSSYRWLVALGEHRLMRAQSGHPNPGGDLDARSASALYQQLRTEHAQDAEHSREARFSLGRAALHYAKVLLAGGGHEDAEMLLHEAREALLTCLPDEAGSADATGATAGEDFRKISPARVSGLLGEVCLRLHAQTRQEEYLDESITWFSTAQQSDAAPDNVHGLLGEAYLRRARAGSMPDLRTALEHKAKARDVGDRNPNNFSVSAAGHHQLWQKTGVPAELATAVDLALRAFRQDPHWPWPLMQLAEFATAQARTGALTPAAGAEDSAEDGAGGPVRAGSGAETGGGAGRDRPGSGPLRSGRPDPASLEAQRLLDAVHEGDQGGLYEEAVRTAVHALPFRQAVLGGRSETFVLDDPQRLLSSTLVLKPTTRAEAEAEQAHLASLGRYLRRTGAPKWMHLPTSLALVDLPEDWQSSRQPAPDTVLASRRSVGRSLAAVIADAYEGRGRHPREAVRRAVQYLARIHVWAAESMVSDAAAAGAPSAVTDSGAVAVPVAATNAYEAVARDLVKRAGRIGLPLPDELGAHWTAVTPQALPSVPGRDAHAENWLVTDSGAVVALDLEPHGHLPLLYEVVQLIEDHAALDLQQSDWPDREALCGVYLAELEALGHPATVVDDDVLAAYQSFALVRAVFLTEHLSQDAAAPHSGTSTGSRRWAQRRLAHALALIERCEQTAVTPGLRDVAIRVTDSLSLRQ